MELLSSIFTLSTAQTALELGCVYALVALALFLSYSILNIADLSTDGCFTLGCAVCCQVTLMGHPFLGLLAAMAAGVLSGYITAFLQTRLGVESILAGIIVNTGLYTINLMAMGFSSTLSVFKCDTIFSLAKSAHLRRAGRRAGGMVEAARRGGHCAYCGAAANVVPQDPPGAFDPRHRRQPGHDPRLVGQPRLHHHGGAVHLRFPYGAFRRGAGAVPEELRY